MNRGQSVREKTPVPYTCNMKNRAAQSAQNSKWLPCLGPGWRGLPCTPLMLRLFWGISYPYVPVAEAKHFLPIHREAPPFVEQSTEQEILVTGIKVR